jgi:hypothetical protein
MDTKFRYLKLVEKFSLIKNLKCFISLINLDLIGIKKIS